MSAYAALSGASYRSYLRDKATLFFTFGFPLLFLLVFGSIFGNERLPSGGRPYIDDIAPGILAWGLANAALFGASFTLMQWRRNDLLRLIRMSPVSLLTVLGSRYLVAIGIGVLQLVLFLGVAMAPPFRLQVHPSWPLLVPGFAVGVLAFLAIGAVIGNLANTPEAVAAVANFLMVPMAFLSGSFFPLDTMPAWCRAVSHVLPLRYLIEAIAGSVTGTFGTADILRSCGALAGFAAVFGFVALRTFRWSARR